MTPKRYSGRLAFDPETLYHVDPDGERVVTDDGGLTWRYATDEDASHNERYEERALVIDTTANELERLAYEHGIEKATKLILEEQPHHFNATPEDEHYDESAPGNARPRVDPDHVAETVTSHTDAWKDA